MKRILFAFALAALAASCRKAPKASPESWFEFKVDGGKAAVVGLTEEGKQQTKVIIPGKYKDFPVTTIGEEAFDYEKLLVFVTIPKGVTYIGSRAFRGCSSLASIKIPSSVTKIGDDVFRDCSSLKDINVDAGNADYCSLDGCLYDKAKTRLIRCSADKVKFEIPSSVTKIDDGAFSGCTSLASIEIPSSVTVIGSRAFRGCTSLASIEIPSSVTWIGGGVFVDSSLRELRFLGTRSQLREMSPSGGIYYMLGKVANVICSDGEVSL